MANLQQICIAGDCSEVQQYTAGEGINISGGVITNTAQGEEYTAGEGIDITDNEVTNTGEANRLYAVFKTLSDVTIPANSSASFLVDASDTIREGYKIVSYIQAFCKTGSSYQRKIYLQFLDRANDGKAFYLTYFNSGTSAYTVTITAAGLTKYTYS